MRAVPAMESLRHAAAEFRRRRRAAGAGHAATACARAADHRIRSAPRISSPKPSASPTPIASAISPTPISCRCRVAGLLAPAYLAARAALVRPDRSLGHALPGTPPGAPLARTRRRRLAGTAFHQPSVHRRCRGQCRRHDHLDRVRVRQPANGARLPAEQPAHRFFLRRRTGRKSRWPTASNPANGRAAPWRRPWCSTATAIWC